MVKTYKIYRKKGGKKIRRSRKLRRGRKTRRMRKHYKGGGGMLARSVKPGYPWTANPATWPGAPASVAPSSCGITAPNHYPVSKWGIPAGVGGSFSPNDPPVSSRNLIGGKRRRRNGKRKSKRNIKKQKGGRIIPQSLVNLSREVVAAGQGLGLRWQGKQFPPSYAPDPLDMQPINKKSQLIYTPPSSIENIYNSAENTVSKM
tara:strand:+ start:33 stop:641 length:609 start_codon:yes stop_codon:yes gene_type:complete